MESDCRTKSSVGDDDDEKLKRRRYQETLGAHVVHRESVVPKGKRIVSKGQEGRQHRNGDDGIDMKMISSKRYKGQGGHQSVVLIGPKNREESRNGVGMVIYFRTEDGIGM